MRILQIAPPWFPVPPPGYGGSESVIDRLARGLQSAGHEVTLFASGDSTCPVSRVSVVERSDGMRIDSIPLELRHLRHAYEMSGDFDVIHDHTVLGPLWSIGRTRAPVFTTCHGLFDQDVCDMYRAVHDDVGVIAISHSQAAMARDLKVSAIIHHGVDPEAFPANDHPGDYLLFLGRMAPIKGVREAALVARMSGQPLIIAAKMREPPERAYFESCVKPLLGAGVEYVGEVGGHEKLQLLAGARALVNPIRWEEPFGLVMIEALACGTPVLAHPSGAAPEIVVSGSTGFLCASLADMVKRVHQLDLLDRRACRARVEKLFSTERMVGDHLDVYASGRLPESSLRCVG
jgi:glycosyltransferase involved in cell wall biosynthesis